MRVLHLIPSISPCRGGPSQAVLEMVAGLRKVGVQASILTTNDDGPGILHDLPVNQWFTYHDVPVYVLSRWSPPIRALREFAIAPALLKFLRNNLVNYDLLHVHSIFSFVPTFAMVLARRRRIPYLVRTIGQLQHWSLTQSALRKRMMLALVERSNLVGASCLHFTSELEQQEALALNLDVPSFVLPLGVHLPPQDLSRNCDSLETTVQFLFLSRLHPKKQLDLLFRALASLQHLHPSFQWTLHIAGDGPEEYVRSLHLLAATLGIAAKLQWHGFVAGFSKRSLLSRADWFLLPSAAENFGIAAAEALAHSLPVVLTPGVALANQVKAANAGIICEPTLSGLTHALADHCLHPPVASMRLNARRLAADSYSWISISLRLSQKYQSLQTTCSLP
jgi:glycosyltransferase involved in cell wall biosynthesis